MSPHPHEEMTSSTRMGGDGRCSKSNLHDMVENLEILHNNLMHKMGLIIILKKCQKCSVPILKNKKHDIIEK